MDLSKDNYEKIKEKIEREWPAWKVELVNKDLLVSVHSEKLFSRYNIKKMVKVSSVRDNVITINKNSTSFNEAPEFRELITNLVNLKRVDEIGVCTDICDFNGIMGLANRLNQENRDVSIYVHEDAVATFNETERSKYVEAAKLLMKQQGINIIRK